MPIVSLVMVLVGLVLNVVGAFFVSVEAMKLENFRRLARKIELAYTRLNPPVEFVDQDNSGAKRRKDSFYIFALLLFLLGLAVLVGIYFGWGKDSSQISFVVSVYWRLRLWAKVVSWLLISPLAILSILGLGLLLYSVPVWFLRLSLSALDWIDAHTPRGTVAIIGFLFLFAGFAMQFAAYLLLP